MQPHLHARRAPLAIAAPLLAALSLALLAAPAEAKRKKKEAAIQSADDLLIVDCLLPHKTRRLGRHNTFLVPRKPIRTAAVDCRIRGGEYTQADQANYATALRVWLPQAEAGDPVAQFYVGQIFEKGLGTEPDYAAAAAWYRKAAEQGDSAAAVGLAYLYEEGLGVARDEVAALNWYRKAAGLTEDLVVLEEADYQALLEARQALEARNAEVKALEREIEALRRQLEELETEAEREAGRETSLRSILERLRADLASRQGEVAAQQARIAALEKAAAEAVASGSASGTRTATETTAPPPSTAAISRGDTDIPFGRYHALVVGNANYSQLPAIANAAEEARLVAELLESKYGFEVTLLIDATRYQIMSALNTLRESLTQDHHLLVYYAGHGTRDAEGHAAYWQPVDAAPENPANWIPDAVVAEHLDVIPARHVLVVADSVFTGLRTRSGVARLRTGMTEDERRHHIRLLLERRSRLVLASGGRRSAGGDASTGASTFTGLFVEALRGNDGILEASALYRQLNQQLAEKDPAAAPELAFAPMRWTRNDLAEFFFVPAG